MKNTRPAYELQQAYQKAIRFAGEKHKNQKMPASKASYLVHLSNVAMEVIVAANHSKNFDLEFAVQVALLHDVIEDTPTSFDEVAESFSLEVAEAVLALSKNEDLPADDQIPDSLRRIKALRKEVWAVKLADRISNMQKPPGNWTLEKKKHYREIAILINNELKGGNAYLESRLEEKIREYPEYY
jgi:guanosine-3',5'-bis(diphosphate) 3'-pyrophosphohydrolase